MTATRQLPHPPRSEITLTTVLAALSDPVRLAIVARLAKRPGEHNWNDFADLGVAPSTLSHHMKTLRLAGLIHHRKAGTRCHVSLRPDLDETLPNLLPTVLTLLPKPPRSRAVSS
jgi:DNA-binding transcriptional ArsR family regulator